ncbi:unnamed protein product, partial [Didymodactylos carnosus]
FYQQDSFNVKPRYECIKIQNGTRTSSKFNNQAQCIADNSQWLLLYSYLEKATQYTSQSSCEQATNNQFTYKWALPHDTMSGQAECLVLNAVPSCIQASWTRSNYLGLKDDAEPMSFDWNLPTFPSNTIKRCLARIRYNISTYDYDIFNIDSKNN